MRMKNLFSAIAILAAAGWLATANPVQAWDFGAWGHAKAVCVPPTCGPSCCPDYVKKPWPCPPCNLKSCLCDDYCPKPLPGFCPVTSCLCDDYCKKPMVCLPSLPCLPWYKCAATACPASAPPANKPAP